MLDKQHIAKCGRCWIPDSYSSMDHKKQEILFTYLLILFRCKIRIPKYLRLHTLYLIVQTLYPEPLTTSKYFDLLYDIDCDDWDPLIEEKHKQIVCSATIKKKSKYLGLLKVNCCNRAEYGVKINGKFYCKAHLMKQHIVHLEYIYVLSLQ